MRRLVLVVLLAVAGLLLVVLGGAPAPEADAPRDGASRDAPGPDASMAVGAEPGVSTAGGVEAAVALEGTASAVPTTPQAVEVIVVDRGGEPIPWASIRLQRHRDGRLQGGTHTSTEADGRKTLDDVLLGSDTIQVLSEADSIGEGVVTEPVTITETPMIVRADRVRRVRRRFVDAETGRPLLVVRAACQGFFGGRARIEESDIDVLRSYSVARRGGRRAFHTTVDAPDGYVHWDREHWYQPLSAYANELEVVVPLRREAIVRLAVLAHDGTPADDAVVEKFDVAGRTVERPTVRRDGFGTLHFSGIPHFVREPLTVRVAIPRTTAFRVWWAWMPASPSEPITGSIRLPKPEPFEGPTNNGTIGIGGSGGGAFSGRSKRGPVGHAEVTVLRHDGSPAVGAKVTLGRHHAITDKRGVARLRDLPVGTHEVTVVQHGLLDTTASITVHEGSTTRRKLAEAKGARLGLEVVDDLGNPLPFARFELLIQGRRHEYVDEKEGVQRIDRYADEEGLRRLARIDPRVTQVKVAWGSRSKTFDVVLTDGKQRELKAVLPAHPNAPGR